MRQENFNTQAKGNWRDVSLKFQVFSFKPLDSVEAGHQDATVAERDLVLLRSWWWYGVGLWFGASMSRNCRAWTGRGCLVDRAGMLRNVAGGYF
jgi:hypothetical protein